MKGAPECMRISGFMHRVNNPELTKRLNEHVPNTMEEMMIATTAFIRGEATAAGKKKGHASWRAHDQSKRQKIAECFQSGVVGQKVPAVIEVREIGGRQDSPMYVTEALSNNRRRSSFYKSMDEFHDRKENLDIFAWQPSDMAGVPRSIAEHRLNIQEGYSPVRQKKRGQAPERAKAIQTEMAESDEEKTAFHISHEVYCYTKMPFGLKNADATYQRLVDKAFDNQVGRNIEVYVDDLVIKSHTKAEMLRDIDETF
ncbi:hypothetical protein Tco_1414707, partial [Tanacetum coccineum]